MVASKQPYVSVYMLPPQALQAFLQALKAVERAPHMFTRLGEGAGNLCGTAELWMHCSIQGPRKLVDQASLNTPLQWVMGAPPSSKHSGRGRTDPAKSTLLSGTVEISDDNGVPMSLEVAGRSRTWMRYPVECLLCSLCSPR